MIACTSSRRRELLASSALLGIDFVEVAQTDPPRLLIYLLEKDPGVVAPDVASVAGSLELDQIRIEGGVRRRNFVPISIEAAVDSFGIGHLQIAVRDLDAPENAKRIGDRSTYELRIDDPRFDTRLNRERFSFTASCPSVADCRDEDHVCPPAPEDTPIIDYMTKDYASFRQLLVDHLDRSAPEWGGAHPADATTAILEVLAYEGDRLSYEQDVVANERTLKTARLRESAARHARLVDYHADDGSSARAFLDIQVDRAIGIAAGARAFTRVADPSVRLRPGLNGNESATADTLADEVFAVMPRTRKPEPTDAEQSWNLDPRLNRIPIHTWGEDNCCLLLGATETTLVGDLTDLLSIGSFLGLRETRGVRTAAGDGGTARETDPDQQFVVRLIEVTAATDQVAGSDQPQTLTRVKWGTPDALPRPVCLNDGDADAPVAEAFGNIVLVEHGRRIGTAIDLPPDFADPTQQYPVVHREALGASPVLVSRDDGLPRSFDQLPASHHLALTPPGGLARVELGEEPIGEAWELRRDMLDSGSDDRHFVIELDRDGKGWIRFGNNTLGARPSERRGLGPDGDIEFRATYWTGDAERGNVARDTIGHIEVDIGSDAVVAVTNPLAAAGGRAPEGIQSIKERAPRQLSDAVRAVRPKDYARRATDETYVQRARARFEWTGSWSSVAVVADALGAHELADLDKLALATRMNEVRLAGYPVEIDRPAYVALDIVLSICVATDHEPWAVVREVEQLLGSGCDRRGNLSFFHPDRLSFAQPVWLSELVAAAGSVPGVISVRPTRFKRLYRSRSDLGEGVIPLSWFEIARVDNDVNRPENGMLRIELVSP